jgi:hypothetical protein
MAGDYVQGTTTTWHEPTRLADFDRKVYAVPYAPKDYRDYDDQVDAILSALVGQHLIRGDFAGLTGEGRPHDFEPYTLVAHRGGLYVPGSESLLERKTAAAVAPHALEQMKQVRRCAPIKRPPTRKRSLIAGILARDGGEVTIDGVSIDIGPPARARSFAIIEIELVLPAPFGPSRP